MADLSAKKANYLSRLMAAVNGNTDLINILTSLYGEALALGYPGGDGATPPATAIVDADLGNFPHLSAATLGEVFASLAATKAFLDANGHTTNFQKMRP